MPGPHSLSMILLMDSSHYCVLSPYTVSSSIPISDPSIHIAFFLIMTMTMTLTLSVGTAVVNVIESFVSKYISL